MITLEKSLLNSEFYNFEKEKIKIRPEDFSKLKLNEMFDEAQEGILITSTNGQPYFANRTAKKLLGNTISCNYKPISRLSISVLQGTNQPYPRRKQPLTLALSGFTTKVENMEILFDRKRIQVIVTGIPIFDYAENLLFGLEVYQIKHQN